MAAKEQSPVTVRREGGNFIGKESLGWMITGPIRKVIREARGMNKKDPISFPWLTVNPVPRTYVRGFGALPFGEVRNIHPRTQARAFCGTG